MNLSKETNAQVYENQELLVADVAQETLFLAREAIKKLGRFNMALAGGHSPKSLYKFMSSMPFREQFPWDKTHLFWIDERWVSPENVRSNYGMVAEVLLTRVDIPPQHIHPIRTDLQSPEASALAYEKDIIKHFNLCLGEFPVFDLIFLGLGVDGHIASHFPAHSSLNEGQRLVISTLQGDIQESRITMSIPVFNHARSVFFVVTDREKASIVHAVLVGPKDDFLLPAQRIHPQKGILRWFLDQKSASLL